MSSYISGNDDDLFDYEPEDTTSSNYTSSDQYHDLLNDIKQSVTSSDDLNTDKARLAIAFFQALYRFTEDPKSESFDKSVSIVLDKLTQGDFSLIKKFYELEVSISRRMQFISLFNTSFDNIDLDDTFTKDLFNFLQIDVTHTYLHACYRTLIHITNHALILDRFIYRSLSDRLSIPVQDHLFDDPAACSSDDHPVYIDDYNSRVNENIYRAIATPDFLQHLSDQTESKVTFVTNDQQTETH